MVGASIQLCAFSTLSRGDLNRVSSAPLDEKRRSSSVVTFSTYCPWRRRRSEWEVGHTSTLNSSEGGRGEWNEERNDGRNTGYYSLWLKAAIAGLKGCTQRCGACGRV